MNYIFYSVYQFIVQTINNFGCTELLLTLKHGSPIFFMAKGHILTVGWFAGRTWGGGEKKLFIGLGFVVFFLG